MSVLGFNFKTITANADGEMPKAAVNVSSAPNITNVNRRDLDFLGTKEVIGVEFEFKTSYDPAVGEIKFTGEPLYKVDDAKKVAKLWKDEKKFDDKIAVDVLNTIFRRCLSKSVDLADMLHLPPPVRFPTVAVEKPKGK